MNKVNSPNFNARPAGVTIDTLVLHYTGMKTAKDALSRLTDKESKVSSHYMIDESGKIYQLVDQKYRAWHAGISHWRGRDSVNDFSIGVELVNRGHEHGYHEFPDAQMGSLINLCDRIIKRYSIDAYNIVGHSDIAPDRKKDPGELFDWKYLFKNGIGIWHDIDLSTDFCIIYSLGDRHEDIKKIQRKLVKFGYKIEETGYYCNNTANVVEAFRRRFTPLNVNPDWCNITDKILNSIFSLGKII